MKASEIKVGDKVAPKNAPTKNALTYGYVRHVWVGTAEMDGTHYAGKTLVEVYWPEIKSAGRWGADDLVIKRVKMAAPRGRRAEANDLSLRRLPGDPMGGL